MNMKLIGAILVVIGCGGVGFSMAAVYHKEVSVIRQLLRVLDYISCELQYHLTPLPQLFRYAAQECSGYMRTVCIAFVEELENQISPNVSNCMHNAVRKCGNIPPLAAELLEDFGRSLGRFDLQGQIQSLEAVRQAGRRKLDALEQNKDVRLRSYQTLGLCAGAALALLLI